MMVTRAVVVKVKEDHLISSKRTLSSLDRDSKANCGNGNCIQTVFSGFNWVSRRLEL